MCAKIILSTDPGIDDAMAIIFLSKLNVLEAIWTTMGNNTLEICTNNSVKILELIGKQGIPIIKGAEMPISNANHTIAGVHGKDGLGNTNRPLPSLSSFTWESLEFIISNIKRFPNEISLVSIGPLTNLANLFQKGPKHLYKKLKQVIIMGGAVTVPGNITPYAEFNIFCDPQAAKIVFSSGMPITLIGLDVTHKAVMTKSHIQKLENKGTEILKFLAEIATFYSKFHQGVGGCYLHDPLAAAAAIDPTLITSSDLFIDVIIDDPKRVGQTIVVEEANFPKISVALKFDQEKFLDMFITSLLQ